MKTYRQTSRNATEIRFANPDAFYDTVTVKAAVQPKKAGSVTVFNTNSAINVQRTVTLPLPAGCTDKCAPLNQEKIALRFSLSGSTQSKVAIKQMIADFRVWLLALEDDLVSGFIPEAVVITTSEA